MKNDKQQVTIIITVVLAIILLYLLSEKFFKLEPVTPHYEQHDQSNRLSKIRQGLQKK